MNTKTLSLMDFITRTLILWFCILSFWSAVMFGSGFFLGLSIFFGIGWFVLTIKNWRE